MNKFRYAIARVEVDIAEKEIEELERQESFMSQPFSPGSAMDDNASVGSFDSTSGTIDGKRQRLVRKRSSLMLEPYAQAKLRKARGEELLMEAENDYLESNIGAAKHKIEKATKLGSNGFNRALLLGIVLCQEGDFDNAFTELTNLWKNKQLRDAMPDEQKLQTAGKIGYLYHSVKEMKDLEKAEEWYRTALLSAPKVRNSNKASIMCNLAVVLREKLEVAQQLQQQYQQKMQQQILEEKKKQKEASGSLTARPAAGSKKGATTGTSGASTSRSDGSKDPLLSLSAKAVNVEVESLLQQAREMDPENPNINYNFANFARVSRKDPSFAASLYEKVLEVAPDHVGSLTNLSRIYLAASRLPEAEALLRRLVKINPDNVQALAALGGVKLYNDAPLGKKLCLKALKLDPGNKSAMVNLANYYRMQGKLEKGERLFKEILRKYPDDDTAMRGLAQLYHNSGNYTEAIAMYQQLLNKNKDDVGIMTSYAALQLFVGNEKVEVVQGMLRRVLEIAPDNASALLHMGCLHFLRHKDPQTASHYFRAAFRSNATLVANFTRQQHVLDCGGLGSLLKEISKEERSGSRFRKQYSLLPRAFDAAMPRMGSNHALLRSNSKAAMSVQEKKNRSLSVAEIPHIIPNYEGYKIDKRLINANLPPNAMTERKPQPPPVANPKSTTPSQRQKRAK